MLWDRERMLSDLTETCVGILVTIALRAQHAAARRRLPVSCSSAACPSQLKTQARTDPKTGVPTRRLAGEATLAVDPARRLVSASPCTSPTSTLRQAGQRHARPLTATPCSDAPAEMRSRCAVDLVGRFGGENSRSCSGHHGDGAYLVAERSAGVSRVRFLPRT